MPMPFAGGVVVVQARYRHPLRRVEGCRGTQDQPLRYYRTNVEGSISLLEAMDLARCRRIIFSSSATVYGTPHYLPYDEAHPVAPVNVYGRTKAIVEGIITDWAATDASRSAALLRYFILLGRMNPVTSARIHRAFQTIWSPISRMLPPASGPSCQSLERP